MSTAPLRHLPRRVKLEYVETMCGKTVTKGDSYCGMICQDLDRVTCERCIDAHLAESPYAEDYFYDTGQY